jgi:hypothetical protein
MCRYEIDKSLHIDCMIFLTLLITSAGILEQSMGARNRVGIML